MGRVAELFEFSPAQSRVIVGLALLALILAGILFVRTYTTSTRDSLDLPVFVADPDTKFTGIFVLDPNTAPADSLELLPGVGKVLADRIVEYRATHHFQRQVDITEVKGIGAKLYEQIRPYLRIVNP
jgi:hypothetical protein